MNFISHSPNEKFMGKIFRANPLIVGCLVISFFCTFSSCQKNAPGSQTPGGPNVNIIFDVKYGSNNDWRGNKQDLLLDVYTPASVESNQKFPLVLFVHGGGFEGGDKAQAGGYLKTFVNSGYVGVSINYRLGWTNESTCSGDTTECKEAIYRSIQDMKAALRYVVAHAEEYHIDTGYLFLSGSSAGAVTVLNSEFLTQAQLNTIILGVETKLGGIDNADNSLTDTYTIKGITAVSGCVGDSEVITNSNAIPLILFHGGQDEVIPYGHGNAHNCPNMLAVDGSVSIYNRMADLGQPCVLHFDPQDGHIPFTDQFRFDNQLCFFSSIINEQVEHGFFKGDATSCP